ncbi:hypothetical protein L208DRAFT_1245095 [Tricholoma matsutake]|nr:hypothetical protein L208DRAFT_1245095 [Tricholoma matsutake 945]
MSVNLSKENFSAMNLRRNGLHFSSDTKVSLDLYPNGCSFITFRPPGRVVVTLCARTPANASFEP